MGWILIFLVVRLSAPMNDRLAFLRSTYSFVLFPLGSHMRFVSASCSTRTSSSVQGSQPSWSRPATWSRISAIRLVMAFSLRRPTNGSGSLRLMPDKRMSSR